MSLIKVMVANILNKGYTANIFPVGETVFDCVQLSPCRYPVIPTDIPCIPAMTVIQ